MSRRNKYGVCKACIQWDTVLLGPFKKLIKRARHSGHTCDLTVSDLLTLWKKQNGRCFYTGVKLSLISYAQRSKDDAFGASLDRVDSNLGYTLSNVVLCSWTINLLKNTLSADEVHVFIAAVRATQIT